MLVYGETYWRRSHQLPGVFTCHAHRCQLRQSLAPCQSDNNWSYFDATQYTLETRPLLCDNIFSKNASQFYAIAQRSHELLLNPSTIWQYENLHSKYRQDLSECGYRGKFSIHEIVSAFSEFYGTHVLEATGCSLNSAKINWLRTILHPSEPHPRHPLRHILLQLFLEHRSSAPSVGARRNSSAWKCPNPYFEHGEMFPITAFINNSRKKGQIGMSARCRCGMWFTFSCSSENDPRTPVIKTVKRLAPSWKSKLVQMRAAGASEEKIASEMALPLACVTRVMSNVNFQSKYTKAPPKQLLNLKAQWEELLSQTPDRNRSSARAANRSLYYELKALDPEWLRTTGTNRPHPARLTSEDWSSRDKEWAARLRLAVTQLESELPPPFLTTTRITRSAGLKPWILSKLDQLPECRRVLST
ncbi:TnsD family Tn7-like transposition protein [Microvirga sp. 0TCS3.31]